MRLSMKRSVSVIAAIASFCLAGCGIDKSPAIVTGGTAIQGAVHGGQQPVTGAKVYLYAAGSTGYGVNATSLLGSPGYVTTDASGSFSITGDYTCPSSNSLLYIIATGGNPGLIAGTVNSNLALMAAVGACGYLGGTEYTLNPSLVVNVNEVTTVASVFALSQFMTPGSYAVGTSSTNTTGLTNAFATVNNLVNISSGLALSTASAGTVTVPQREINSLADILATCVNSAGGTGACTTLFTNTTPSSGTAPNDTIGAALNISRYPWNNVTALNNLISATAPFQPNLTYSNGSNVDATVPSDWTIATTVSATGAAYLAIDGAGNIWTCSSVGYFGSVSVVGMTNTGSIFTGANGYSGGPYTGNENSCYGINLDLQGNIWVSPRSLVTYTCSNDTGMVEFSPSGTMLSPQCGYGGSYFYAPAGFSIDGSNHLWIADFGTGPGFLATGVTEFDTSGNALTSAYLASVGPDIISVDNNGNIWAGSASSGSVGQISSPSNTIQACTYQIRALVDDGSGGIWTDCGTKALIHVSSSGTVSSNTFSQYLTSGGAIDGAGTVWMGCDCGIAPFNSSGTALSPNGLADYGSEYATNSLAIDSSGNIWVIRSNGIIQEVIGTAAPVTTPYALALKNSAVGHLP